MEQQVTIPPLEVAASGNGAPLVLVPGGLTGWLSWIPHAEALSATHRVIRVQLHSVALGLSGAPLPAAYSIDYEAVALNNTLEELSIAQSDFAGWSYGGLVALTFALAHPRRVRSLTLVEPPAYTVLRSLGPYSPSLKAERAFFQSVAGEEVSEKELVEFTHAVGLLPQDVDPRTLPQWPQWNQHRQALRTADMPFQHEVDLNDLRRFQKPVLLVKGDDSAASLHQVVDVLAETLPNARVVTFPGKHAPHIVSMQPFLEQFTRFLSDQKAN